VIKYVILIIVIINIIVVGVTRTDSGELGSTRTDTTTDGRIRVGLGKEHEEKERAQLELTEICSLTDIHLNLDSSACTIQVSANLHHNCCLARLGNGYIGVSRLFEPF